MIDIPPIWVINLQRSPHRRAYMQKQLESRGLTFEFVDAVDGRLLTAEQRGLYSQSEAMAYYGRELSDAEIGCALSHARVYERMVERGLPELLVLEDDVELGDEFWLLVQMRDMFPPDWEAINFASDIGDPLPFGPSVVGAYRLCRFAGRGELIRKLICCAWKERKNCWITCIPSVFRLTICNGNSIIQASSSMAFIHARFMPLDFILTFGIIAGSGGSWNIGQT